MEQAMPPEAGRFDAVLPVIEKEGGACGLLRDLRSPHPCTGNRALLRLKHNIPHISTTRGQSPPSPAYESECAISYIGMHGKLISAFLDFDLNQ